MGSFLIGLIGSGIGPSLSPPLHEQEAVHHGLHYVYRLLDTDRLGQDVGELVRTARRFGFDGLNITHPCKQSVIPHLDELSPDARMLGAVNTVVFDGDRAVGHNTDWTGFAESFARGLPDAPARHVVQLGAGGAGAAVAHALLTMGADLVTVVDAEPARARALAGELTGRFGPGRARHAAPAGLPELLAAAPAGPTAWCMRPRPAWRTIRACRCRPGCCTRACGWPTSSTGRWRPSCCGTRGPPAAGRWTAAAWWSSRPCTPSACSPGGSRTPSACSPT
ncbi:shikimate dehydrogenase [Actinomadura sp. ATCC 31491]|uniref:Shikimate dehydrogenase n=1 Tax=Actinomadura luzonensis TaxID=2805427 RepID=A0ABT0FXD2_9ACTN|nr:shikimate dehydrogenase [Actinomadura luzonensis]